LQKQHKQHGGPKAAAKAAAKPQAEARKGKAKDITMLAPPALPTITSPLPAKAAAAAAAAAARQQEKLAVLAVDPSKIVDGQEMYQYFKALGAAAGEMLPQQDSSEKKRKGRGRKKELTLREKIHEEWNGKVGLGMHGCIASSGCKAAQDCTHTPVHEPCCHASEGYCQQQLCLTYHDGVLTAACHVAAMLWPNHG
jgi:hypothetical protein